MYCNTKHQDLFILGVQIEDKTINRLDSLQKTLLRSLLCVPTSTPGPAINWDTGFISVNYRVFQKKLLFLFHLKHLDETSLANEIFELQKKFNTPGFVIEGRRLLERFSLPNIIDQKHPISQLQWRKMVQSAIHKN